MEGTISEIRHFGPNRAPRNWFPCDGRLLPISQYTELFSLIGTLYGGDGRSTFGLPDLRGRVPVGADNGPGRTPRINGQAGGAEYIKLNVLEIPSHKKGAAISLDSVSTLIASTGAGTAGTASPGTLPGVATDLNGDPVNLYTNSGSEIGLLMPLEMLLTYTRVQESD